MSDHVRYGELVRTCMEVLRDRPGVMPRGELRDEVERRIVPNSAEQRIQSNGYPAWITAMGYHTGDAASAGWLVKSPEGWRLTDEGRAALQEFPTADALYDEIQAQYRALARDRKAAQRKLATSMSEISGLLEGVPPGSWTSYEDVAIASGSEAADIAHLLASTPFTNSYRVLNTNGSLPQPRFQHANNRGTDLRGRLAGEGVEFDASDRAVQEQRLTGEMLREHYVELAEETAAEGTRAWLVRGSAVSGYNVVPGWLTMSFVSIAASHLRQVEIGTSLDNLRAAVEADYAHLSYAQRKTKLAELHAFLNRVGTGDAVVTTSEGRVYVGRIDGDPTWHTGESLTTIRRAVNWEVQGIDWSELSDTMQARLKSASTVIDLTEAAEAVEALFVGAPDDGPATDESVTLPDLSPEEAERLLVGKDWLYEFVDLLRDRRHVILYGPPGTGKTYLALEVASALTDPANVSLVQFHPAYSYEDFFEGYRPTAVDESGTVRFALTPGPFRKIVDQAREDPGRPYILIIDEINRANLAKVFGELYFLLEYRKRTIDLMYASGDEGRDFSLPENVYVIGTMNTADRSIALVDAAMRRRFAFLSLHPDDVHMAGVLRGWLDREALTTHPADLLDELNRRVPDKDFKIGPAYLMRKDVATDDGLERIWRTQLLPLLEEFHYGDSGVSVAKRYGLAALRSAVGPREAPAVESTPTDESTDAD